MINVVLIRHFATKGNLEGRYIGTTDEPLCDRGRAQGSIKTYPPVEILFSSPRKRCKETAAQIYPNHKVQCREGFGECDFGIFEGKNYEDLKYDPLYQAWIDSGGRLAFPKGESLEQFQTRTVDAWDMAVQQVISHKYKTMGMIAHGGTIMSILDRYSSPRRSYFKWQAGNGEGYCAELDETHRRLSNICCIH